MDKSRTETRTDSRDVLMFAAQLLGDFDALEALVADQPAGGAKREPLAVRYFFYLTSQFPQKNQQIPMNFRGNLRIS